MHTERVSFDQMLDMEGQRMTFVVRRKPTAIERDGLDKSISEAAMQDLVQDIANWIGSRIGRAQRDLQIGPQAIGVEVVVRMDTDAFADVKE